MFKTKELKKLTKENILKSLEQRGYNELDLCRYYITGFKNLGTSVNSDLRHDDKNASLHVRVKNGILIISDFGYKIGMSIYTYLQEKNFTRDKKGYIQALDLIREDFQLIDISSYYNSSKKYPKKAKKKPIKHNLELIESLPVRINIKPRAWNKDDIIFWKRYNITKQDFKDSNIIIKPISKFRIINEQKNTISEIKLENNLSYAYCAFYNKQWHYKIYSPYGVDGKGTMKWVSNIKNGYLFGVLKPKNTDVLIIQSSIKDKVIIDKMGHYCLPLLAEGIWFENDIWKRLKKTFKKIIYFANNDWEKQDNPGFKLAKKHFDNYKFDRIITTPKIEKVTDISDYTKRFGFKKAKLYVDELIKNQ